MPVLKLTSRARARPLTDRETVRLGRLLGGLSARRHVSFPDDTPTVVAIVSECDALLEPRLREKVADVLGDFDQAVESERAVRARSSRRGA